MQARQTNNTHEQQQQWQQRHTESTHSAAPSLSWRIANAFSAIILPFILRAFLFVGKHQREGGEGAGVAAGWGVLHIKFLSLCHVYRCRASLAPPAGSRHQIGCFSTEMQHLFRVACCISFAYLAPKLQCTLHRIPPPPLATLCTLAVGRKSPKILFIMSPYRQQQLCLSLHFGLLCLPHSSLPLPACLVVCFCRASERFAHLPVYMCCAVVYCSQWAWQGARETVIKRASAVACCHIKLPIYFLGLQQQRCNLATFCATDKFLCISYGCSPTPHVPFPPPCHTKRCKIALRILMIKLISSSSNCHVNACPCNCHVSSDCTCGQGR